MTLKSNLRRLGLRLSGRALHLQQRLHARLERGAAAGGARAPYVLRYTPSSSEQLVVHANGNFAVGGSTQLIVDLIELGSDAYRHEVVVPHSPSPLPYEPVDLHVMPVDRLEGLRAFLKAKRPALVHIHYWSRAENRFDATGVWYATVLAICDELGLPVVQNINVPTRPMVGGAVRRNVYVSRTVLDEYDGGQAPAEVVHPGCDFSVFDRQEVADAPDVIGMVYRLDSDKLNARSIEPFIRVARARPSTRCLIVGEGQFSGLYRRRVEEEGLQRQFEFAGMASYADLPALYARMGVFVAPVHNESFGQVTPFAMGMRLPVAGYDVGALAEILGSKDTLTSPGDEEALASAIIALLERPEERRRLGAANHDRAQRLFSREAMVARYKAIYADVLAGA
jgi:glycosyltransferase involved in cell wall biosynthesis